MLVARLRALPVRAQLALAFALLACLAAALGAGAVTLLGREHARFATVYNDRLIPLRQLAAVRAQLQRVQLAQARGDGATLATLRTEAQAAADVEWRAYLATFLTPEEAALVARARPALAAAWQPGASLDAIAAAQGALDALQDLQVRVAATEYASATDAYRRSRWIAGGAVVVVVLLALAVGARVTREIGGAMREIGARARSLRAHCLAGLDDGLQAMARGDLTVDVVPMTTPITVRWRNDLGALAEDVNAMIGRAQRAVSAYAACRTRLDALLAETTRLAEAGRQGELQARGDAAHFDGAYRGVIEALNATLDAQVAPTHEAARVLAALAERDLTGRMTGDFAGDHAVLQHSFNTGLGALAGALVEMADATELVAAASSQIADAAGQLAEDATRQSAGVERVAQAAHAVEATATTNSASSQHASVLARSAQQSVEQQRAELDGLVAAVDDIRQASHETRAILKSIEEIAFQTNLLALNAAVEAARAGDAGRGFAVVAEEVRALAHRSADAARRTASVTERSVRSADTGRARVLAVVGQLQEVESCVEQVSATMETIADASREQASSLQAIAETVDDLRGLVRRVEDSAQASAAAAGELAEHAAQLRGASGSFRVDAEAGVTVS